MEGFTYCNPVRVVFGPGSVERVGVEARGLGRRVLLVSGKGHAEASGLLGRVQGLLEAEGLQVALLRGVAPNPRLSSVIEGVETCRRHQADLVVALGGGSVMDASKIIAAAVFYPHDPWDLLRHGQDPYVPAARSLPTIMVPTLAATGSEMNCNAVITNERTTEKCGISHPVFYPKVAIVDPALTCSVPANHTAYGAMDTIAHVIESYLNGADDTPVQDRLREGVMLTVIEEAPKALAEPGNLSARTNLQWASVVALNGWANIGAGGAFPMHQIEHALSAHYDIAHGAGLAVVVPAWIKTAWRAWPERHAQLANRVFGVAACEPEAAVREGLARFEGFLKRIGNPTRLGDVGIGPEKLDRIAADVIRLSGGRERLLGGRPRLDQAGVRSVLARAL